MAILLKVFTAANQKELLYEEFAIEDGDVGGPADDGVGVGGQRVEGIVSDQSERGMLHQGLEDIMHHVDIGGACNYTEACGRADIVIVSVTVLFTTRVQR